MKISVSHGLCNNDVYSLDKSLTSLLKFKARWPRFIISCVWLLMIVILYFLFSSSILFLSLLACTLCLRAFDSTQICSQFLNLSLSILTCHLALNWLFTSIGLSSSTSSPTSLITATAAQYCIYEPHFLDSFFVSIRVSSVLLLSHHLCALFWSYFLVSNTSHLSTTYPKKKRL